VHDAHLVQARKRRVVDEPPHLLARLVRRPAANVELVGGVPARGGTHLYERGPFLRRPLT